MFSNRRNLWPRLARLKPIREGAWCCLGDFNEMLYSTDKYGIRSVEPIRMCLFRDFLDETRLMDLSLQGCKYTWLSNPRDGNVTRQKIKRVLANWNWRNLYPHTLATALPVINSDHSPIVLKPKPPLTSGKSFKYEAIWEEHEECGGVVAEGWDYSGVLMHGIAVLLRSTLVLGI